MLVEAVYLVELPDSRVDIFTQSHTGSLDFSESFSGAGASERARAAASSLAVISGWSELRYRDSYGSPPLYEAETFRPRVHRSGGAGTPTREIAAFFLRYPAWRSACLQGNFIEAGAAVQRSKKLKPFRHILRHLVGSDLFLIFALYWLQEFDARKGFWLAQLLSGSAAAAGVENPATENPYAQLFDFARPGIRSGDVQDFTKELDHALRDHLLRQGRELILPIVGENFSRTIAEIRARASQALDEGRRRALTEGLAGTEARVRAWLESIEFSIQRESWNRADQNALCILARFPEDGRSAHAGYIRADIAARLAPIADSGGVFRARMVGLGEGGVKLGVGIGKKSSTEVITHDTLIH
jgi:hypothetical protein